jgi:hypothetical protein
LDVEPTIASLARRQRHHGGDLNPDVADQLSLHRRPRWAVRTAEIRYVALDALTRPSLISRSAMDSGFS